MLPSISFIVPVFNGDDTIVRCIETIKGISYPTELFEIIVVDNCSTDNTRKVLDSIEGITVFSEEKKGRSNARNKGWRNAKHDLIAFIDADVFLEKQWARFLVRLFEDNPQMACAQGHIIPGGKECFLKEYRTWRKHHQTSEFKVETIIKNLCFPIVNSASCMYRKSVLEELNGFDESLKRFEDIDLSFRASARSYIVGYETQSVSYVFWKGERISTYLKREWENGKWSVILSAKYVQKQGLFHFSLVRLKAILLAFLIPAYEFRLNFFEFLLRLIFTLGSLKELIFGRKEYIGIEKENVFSFEFGENKSHQYLKDVLGEVLNIRITSSINSLYSDKEVRVVQSHKFVHFYRNELLNFKDEEAHFLKDLLENREDYYNKVSGERYKYIATLVLSQLVRANYLYVEVSCEDFCFNPFNSFRKVTNPDDSIAYFIVTQNVEFQFESVTNLFFQNDVNNSAYFINDIFEKSDWDLVQRNISPELFFQLTQNNIIIEKKRLDEILSEPFSLKSFIAQNESEISQLSKQFKVSSFLTRQFSGESVFESKIFQMNNFFSLCENLYWVKPYKYNYPYPVHLGEEIVSKLKEFDQTQWSAKELYSLWKSGVLEEEAFLEIDTEKLRNDFLSNQYFSFTMKESDYLIWSLDNFLYLFFNSGAFKVGDVQCANRKAVYDNFLCLHLQKGFEDVLNRFMPFEVKASFNYSVCYLPTADLYPHKDRDEAPYSMSLNLGTYLNNKELIASSNILGVKNDDGDEGEIELSFGDAALFNGYELTHYRHQIPEKHFLNVIVMHFVKADFEGAIG